MGGIRPKITVLSQYLFDEYCINHALTDANVERDTQTAYISIVNTYECLKYYLDDTTTRHWFYENHPNVLNLDFDDVGYDMLEWKGHVFVGITDEQAEETVKFIERNILEYRLLGDNFMKDFVVHCRAGMSRSQAVARFMKDYYKEYFNGDWYDLMDHYNKHTYAQLRKAYERLHGCSYEEEEKKD